MARISRWPALLAAVTVIAGCGGGSDTDDSQARATATAPPTRAAATTPARTGVPTTPAATATTNPNEPWRMMAYVIPTDEQLPDRVSYQGETDLSNEEAAKDDPALLQQFKDAGRQNGIQFLFSVEAGAHVVSVGVSYYDNTAAPLDLLRQSGDPAAAIAPPRFEVAGLGDQYIAQRLKLGSGEGTALVINIAWVRGRYFVSLADLGVKEDTPVDIAVAIAREIDKRLAERPRP